MSCWTAKPILHNRVLSAITTHKTHDEHGESLSSRLCC